MDHPLPVSAPHPTPPRRRLRWGTVVGLWVAGALALAALGQQASTTQKSGGKKQKPVTPLLPPPVAPAPGGNPAAPATQRPPTPPTTPPASGAPATSGPKPAPPARTAAPAPAKAPSPAAAKPTPSPPTVPAPKTATFPEPFARLHYAPIPKPDYPGNPRREVRGLYVTHYSASSSNALKSILAVVDQTRLNALVIDVKDDTGRLLHRSEAAARYNPKAGKDAPIRDLTAYVRRLRERKVYAIARIVTFKDPVYAEAHPDRALVMRDTGRLFRSSDTLAWGSPHDPEFRAYNLAIAVEAARAGFNEVQFDYIRFPEVADDARVDYRNPRRETKAQAVQSFLLDARRQLAPLHVYLSADVFGLVCAARDDMRLGQYWEAISAVVDYISPMSYPSHYAPGSYGLAVPDLHPYDLMHRATRDALRRNENLATPARLRPWIQGFTARWLPQYRRYGVPEIQAQIRALADHGVHSYLVWNPGNRYRDQQTAFK